MCTPAHWTQHSVDREWLEVRRQAGYYNSQVDWPRNSWLRTSLSPVVGPWGNPWYVGAGKSSCWRLSKGFLFPVPVRTVSDGRRNILSVTFGVWISAENTVCGSFRPSRTKYTGNEVVLAIACTQETVCQQSQKQQRLHAPVEDFLPSPRSKRGTCYGNVAGWVAGCLPQPVLYQND